MPLCDFEKDVLRMMNGEEQDSVKGWGAGLSVAIEALKGGGYVSCKMTDNGLEYFITDKGREAIAT